MNKPTFKHICLMHIQQLTNFPYIEKDFDALTDYGLLCKVVDYLNQVITNENAQNENIVALYNAFIELKTYVESFFDNLDVQDEINNKLDEMAEDGTLDQIIEQYLNSSAIWGFDTVADMKNATNLIDGSYARTLGYYSKNDGGAALYKIRTITNDDIVDEAQIIALYDDNLIGELIIDEAINVKQFGAYGDNIHDDTIAIQKALLLLNEYKVIIPEGTYLINTSLNLTDKNYRNINLEASDSIIKYSGNSYAFIMKSINYAYLNFGTIEATNGGCIMFYANQESDASAYVHINFMNFKASSNCIYATRTGGWINEFIVNGGKFTSGEWGVNLEINSDDEGNTNGWKFYNTCIEGVSNGFKFNAINGKISGIAIINPRYDETDTYTNLIQTIGKCNDIRFIGNSTFYMYKSSFSNNTYYVLLQTPTVYKNFPVFYNGGIIKDGDFIPNDSNYPQLNNYINTIVDNDDLNNYLYPGTYTSYGVSSSSSVSNLPVGGYSYLGFRLYVVSVSHTTSTYESHKNINQLLINGSDRMFMRNIHWESNSYSYGEWREITNHRSGNSSSRPSSCGVGYLYFDTTLGKPIWYNGTGWVDATGTQV